MCDISCLFGSQSCSAYSSVRVEIWFEGRAQMCAIVSSS